MTISMNLIPNNIRVPLFYAEFDNTKASQVLALKNYVGLILGQKTSAGTATANTLYKVASADQVKTLGGVGSQLHRMAIKWFKNNTTTEVWIMPVADNGAGVAASCTLTFSGPATADGTLSFLIGGQLVEVGVSKDDTDDDMAAATAAAINAATFLGVTASAASEVVTVTNKHKGLVGNKMDVRINYASDQKLPAGAGVVIGAMGSGTTAPDLTNAIAALGDKQFDIIAHPYTDATTLAALEAELLDRSGPIRQIDGFAITAQNETVGNLTTLGNSRNSQFSGIFPCYKFPNPPEEVAAAAAAQIALSASIDPALTMQTLQLNDILAPAEADKFNWNERNTLLFDGISSLVVGPGEVVQIEAAITTYQLNANAVPDTSYLYINVPLVLSYLRYSLKAFFTSRYGRCKLAKDGTRFGPGQKVITPKIAKAEILGIFRQWEESGLVEGFDQFKNDLIVEINSQNPNRLDAEMGPDLINNLTVMGVKIAFLN